MEHSRLRGRQADKEMIVSVKNYKSRQGRETERRERPECRKTLTEKTQ